VATSTLLRQVKKMRQREAEDRRTAASPLERLRADPSAVLTRAGFTPDPWQADLLRSPWQRALLLCSRQVGKTRVAAAVALRTALLRPRSLILLLSASERQAKEFFATYVVDLWEQLGRPVAGEALATTLRLANRSRVIALPENERTIRVFAGVTLLVIDEAVRVPEELYYTVRPMLSVSRGSLLALTTPFGRRGWFYEAWSGPEPWKRVGVPATACSRHTPEFLAEERRSLGERWFRQEYGCSFEDVVGAVFCGSDIDAAFTDAVTPLFAEPAPPAPLPLAAVPPDPLSVPDVTPLFGTGEL
jgi:hypothetical protein